MLVRERWWWGEGGRLASGDGGVLVVAGKGRWC